MALIAKVPGDRIQVGFLCLLSMKLTEPTDANVALAKFPMVVQVTEVLTEPDAVRVALLGIPVLYGDGTYEPIILFKKDGEYPLYEMRDYWRKGRKV